MKVMIASETTDIHDMIMRKYPFRPTPTTVHDRVNAAAVYAQFRPDLLIVDRRYPEMKDAEDVIRAYEKAHELKPVTMQFVDDNRFMKALQPRPSRPQITGNRESYGWNSRDSFIGE
ncbi:MAG: hypothetical protein WC613_02115 [Candidatus Aenigmatarchaeota archaeon]